MLDKTIIERAFVAARKGDVEAIKSLELKAALQSEAAAGNDATCDALGSTLVHVASRLGRVPLLEHLVWEVGIPAARRTAVGALPAHDASATGNLEALEWLLEHGGCGLQDTDSVGNTYTHLAARYGHMRVLKWLLAAWPHSSLQKTAVGAVPLHFAAAKGDLDSVKYLVEQKPGHVHETNPDDLTCPCCRNDQSVNAQMESGVTAAYLAAQQGHMEVLRYLVEEGGASVRVLAYDGMSCMHAAAQNGHCDVIEWLVTSQKLGVNDRDFDGASPMHFAAARGQVVVMAWLMQHGARLTTDNLGGTALHDAAEHGQLQCVRLLLQHGCDTAAADHDGLTPGQLAQLCWQAETAAMLHKQHMDGNTNNNHGTYSSPSDVDSASSTAGSERGMYGADFMGRRLSDCGRGFDLEGRRLSDSGRGFGMEGRTPSESGRSVESGRSNTTGESHYKTGSSGYTIPPPPINRPPLPTPAHPPPVPAHGNDYEAIATKAPPPVAKVTVTTGVQTDEPYPEPSPPEPVYQAVQPRPTPPQGDPPPAPPPPPPLPSWPPAGQQGPPGAAPAPPPPPPPLPSTVAVKKPVTSRAASTPALGAGGSRVPPSSSMDLIAELKAAKGAASLKRTKKSTGSSSTVFISGSSKSAPPSECGSEAGDAVKLVAAGERKQPVLAPQQQKVTLAGRYDPKNFLDKVPLTDTSGRDMPPWKRLIVARQLAEKAQKTDVVESKRAEEERRWRDMPAWKRAMIEKKERDTPSPQNTPPPAEDLPVVREADKGSVDEDGLPSSPWQRKLNHVNMPD